MLCKAVALQWGLFSAGLDTASKGADMGCGCAEGIKQGVDRMRGIWGRFYFQPHFPRTNPAEIAEDATERLGMAPMGVATQFDARPMFRTYTFHRERYPFPDQKPTWYTPVANGAHDLNDRMAVRNSGNMVRPYSAGIQRGESQALWGVQRRVYQVVRALPQQERAGAVDARTALALKQGPALQFPRWFTGAIDEDALVERARML